MGEMDVERYAKLHTGSKSPEKSRLQPDAILMVKLVAPVTKTERAMADIPWDLATLPIVYQELEGSTIPLESTGNEKSCKTNPSAKSPESSSTSLVGEIAHEVQGLADHLWTRLAWSIKQTVRNACSEVLRRTNDPSNEEQTCWIWDDDAQLLD